jgi:hypothetical protein
MKAEKEISGLNIQWPWTRLILSGQKTVETRSYPLPKKYIGKELAIIETPGKEGRKSAGIIKAKIIGVVVFSESFVYENKDDWIEDYHRHRVNETDPTYGFSKEKPKWAWVIKNVRILPQPVPPPKKRGIIFAVGCKV